MAVSCKFERSLLSHEEHETIRVTHHPAIYEHDAEGLKGTSKNSCFSRPVRI
jgi:hypothetical protein